MADWSKIVELDPSSVEAKTHITRLKPIVDERNERLKEEMMGKLKDLGMFYHEVKYIFEVQ